MEIKSTIQDVFNLLSDEEIHKAFIKKRIIKIILGSSVIRALPSGTKPKLIACIESLPEFELSTIKSNAAFVEWHLLQVTQIEKCLESCDKKSKRFKKGQLFGHAVKVFNLYLSHLVLFSGFFNPSVVSRVKYYLQVPLDSKVFSAIRNENGLKVPKSIKALDKKSYQLIQNEIRYYANLTGVPSVYFDDFAWAGDQG